MIPMKSNRREGYLIIDHSASPGLPEDVAIRSGFDPKMVGEGKVLEAATMTCAHCKCTVVKNPWRTRERASCQKCSGRYICDICATAACQSSYQHAQFEKVAEAHLNQAVKTPELAGTPAALSALAPVGWTQETVLPKIFLP